MKSPEQINQMAENAAQALAEYHSASQATLEKMQRLRALRIAEGTKESRAITKTLISPPTPVVGALYGVKWVASKRSASSQRDK